MIRCNLALLLAERNLSLTKVAHQTGISRTTLTALEQNKSKGIQFPTINTLCTYLKVAPNDLLSFIPVEVNIQFVKLNLQNIGIQVFFTDKNIKYETNIYGHVNLIQTSEEIICETNIVLDFSETTVYNCFPDNYIPEENDRDIELANHKKLSDIIKALPKAFLNDIESEILDQVYKLLVKNKYRFNKAIAESIDWIFL